MATLLDIKEFVTNQIGADNASTSVSKRDKIINQARRQFYSERQWSFLNKSSSVSLSSQLGSLPSNYNNKFQPKGVYTYNGNTKYDYTQVEWGDITLYPTDQYVFALDKVNSQIKINQSSVSSVTLDYTYLPADKATDGTEDDDSEPIDDITPIGLLALAKWWLSSERGTGKYLLFKDEYQKQLAKDIASDAGSEAVRPLLPRVRGIKTGYHSRVV